MAKSDKKAKKAKIAGATATLKVKLPKKLRKAGEKAVKLAGQPVVSEIVAAALLSAAAALRDGEPGGGKGKKASGGGAVTGESLRTLAIDLARRTLDSWDRGAAAGKGGADSGGGKKKQKKEGGNG